MNQAKINLDGIFDILENVWYREVDPDEAFNQIEDLILENNKEEEDSESHSNS